jgi:hypothetical protein
LRAFFAFFAARFSFRVLPCFFVLVFWTDLLAMTVSLVGPRPVWLCTSERCSRVRDGLTVRPLARRAPATVPGRQRRRRGGAIARRARCGHRLDHEVRLARLVAQTRPTGVGRWRSPRRVHCRVHYGRPRHARRAHLAWQPGGFGMSIVDRPRLRHRQRPGFDSAVIAAAPKSLDCCVRPKYPELRR